ncbi:MAG: PHP domain-containing protein, partial [Methanolinea sp.]|nr:PHP domain-containing protein [Methanolinea sp.]
MYDLHTHTTLSDGEMLPMELIRRMAVLGYDTVAVTDHADGSNLETLLAVLPGVRESANIYGVRLLCGVELTHVPPTL